MIPTLVSWSGGKDCAMALFELRRAGKHDVRGLVTTVGRDDGRIPFHGVHADLVRAQADALGLPLIEVRLPAAASNVQYEAALRDALAAHVAAGVDTMAYGDLCLQDIRAYREGLAARIGVRPIFPIWGCDTGGFARDVVARGVEAIIVSVDTSRLDASFAGRRFDADFLGSLPPGVNPCGENGEFHTFVVDGPGFAWPVRTSLGGRVELEGYCYREPVLADR